MKSMDKTSRGNGFTGVLKYNLGKGKGQVVGGNMSSTDINQLAREFRTVANFRSDIKKPVWHQSLRLPAHEKIDEAKFVMIANEYMERMGFCEHQYTLILDDMKSGQHMHIIANRVNIDGGLYYGKNENLISSRTCGELEIEFGLEQTKQAESSSRRDKSKLKKSELEQALRTGEKAPKQQIQEIIDELLNRTAFNLDDFEAELLDLGVHSKRAENKSGLVGYSFSTDNNVWFKGSQLGKDYSKKRLIGRGLHDGIEIKASSEATKPTNIDTTENRAIEQRTAVRDSESENRAVKNTRFVDSVSRKSELEASASSKKSKCFEQEQQRLGQSTARQKLYEDSLAYRFFSRDFVANSDFKHCVAFHDVKTKTTVITTNENKGSVQAVNDNKATSSSNDTDVNADLLTSYAKLRNWSFINTESNNAEFLSALQHYCDIKKIELKLNDSQFATLTSYELRLK
jgi:hypothetical protein